VRHIATWLVTAALFLPAAAPAFAKSYRAEADSADVQILDNGDLRVTERFRFRFIGGPFTRMYRSVPARGTDGIEVEPSAEAPVVTPGRTVQVVWNFPACADTVKTFTLVYRARGVLRAGGDRRGLEWRAFPSERRYAISAAVARLSWPASWPEPLRVEAGPGPVHATREPHAAVFTTGRLPAKRTLWLRVEFAAAGIAAPPPHWQARQAEIARFLALAGGLALAIVASGIVLVLLLYRELAPQRPPLPPRARQTVPPSEMPAALAGVLMAGDAQFHHLLACLADLAARGQLGFEAALSKRFWGGGEYVIRRTKQAPGVEPWEQAVLDALSRYERDGATSWSRGLVGLRGSMAAFRAATRAELQRRGDFDAHASERPRPLYSVALVGAVLAVATFAAAAWQWQRWGPATLLPGVALVIVAAVALAAATAVPRYTAAGYQRAMAWRAFAGALRAMAKGPQPFDSALFQAWFPYTLALGVAAVWMQAGKKWKLAPPGWFQVPGADAMAGFAALFAGASAAPTGVPGSGSKGTV
jgi:hypothetical protein